MSGKEGIGDTIKKTVFTGVQGTIGRRGAQRAEDRPVDRLRMNHELSARMKRFICINVIGKVTAFRLYVKSTGLSASTTAPRSRAS